MDIFTIVSLFSVCGGGTQVYRCSLAKLQKIVFITATHCVGRMIQTSGNTIASLYLQLYW